MTTLPPSCAVVTKSVYLNFLEHSGPLQACNGTALPYWEDDKYVDGCGVEYEGKRAFGRPRLRRENNIKTDLKGIEGEGRTKFIWLSVGISSGLLLTRQWNFEFHIMR